MKPLTIKNLILSDAHLIVDQSVPLYVIAQLNQLLRQVIQSLRAHDGLRLAQAALKRIFGQIVLALECREPRPVELVPEPNPIVVLGLVVLCELLKYLLAWKIFKSRVI